MIPEEQKGAVADGGRSRLYEDDLSKHVVEI